MSKAYHYCFLLYFNFLALLKKLKELRM